MSTLSGSGLSKTYSDTEVVHQLDLEVHPAEVVGLLGPNGAGKTTTFNMLAGGIRPSSGRVSLGEAEITDLPMYRRARLGITYLPRNPRFSESFPSPTISTRSWKRWSRIGPCAGSVCESFWRS